MNSSEFLSTIMVMLVCISNCYVNVDYSLMCNLPLLLPVLGSVSQMLIDLDLP